MSLYSELVEAGVQIANHESDLYFPKTAQTTEILNKYPTEKANATTYINQVEGGVWYDVPFSHDPFWIERQVR